MSGGVDVLRVLTQTIADAEVRDRRYAETLREARVAVSELIEADREYDEAQAHVALSGSGREEWEAFECATARRAAALQRITSPATGGGEGGTK